MADAFSALRGIQTFVTRDNCDDGAEDNGFDDVVDAVRYVAQIVAEEAPYALGGQYAGTRSAAIGRAHRLLSSGGRCRR